MILHSIFKHSILAKRGVPSKVFIFDGRVSTESFTVPKVAIRKHSAKSVHLLSHSVKFNMGNVFCISHILKMKKEGNIS